jgi:hypothetical protein
VEGGILKLLLLGIIIPAALGYVAARWWVTGEATWPGMKSSHLTVQGGTARALALACFGVALLIHARWCWGVLRMRGFYAAGTILALIGILAGLGLALWLHFS